MPVVTVRSDLQPTGVFVPGLNPPKLNSVCVSPDVANTLVPRFIASRRGGLKLSKPDFAKLKGHALGENGQPGCLCCRTALNWGLF